VELFPKAVSARDGVVSFQCEREHNLSAVSTIAKGPGTVMVPTVALDCLLTNESVASRLVGIKLDTEGHELESLQGATRLIEKRDPWLIVEFNTALLSSDVLEDWSVHQLLTDRGYRPFMYDKRGTETGVVPGYSLRGYRHILFRYVSADSASGAACDARSSPLRVSDAPSVPQ
jgi:hypothetical protein